MTYKKRPSSGPPEEGQLLIAAGITNETASTVRFAKREIMIFPAISRAT
jgi:hypothetical protein